MSETLAHDIEAVVKFFEDNDADVPVGCVRVGVAYPQLSYRDAFAGPNNESRFLDVHVGICDMRTVPGSNPVVKHMRWVRVEPHHTVMDVQDAITTAEGLGKIEPSVVVGNFRDFDKKAPEKLDGHENAFEMFDKSVSLDVEIPRLSEPAPCALGVGGGNP